jgi:hypothetical protein
MTLKLNMLNMEIVKRIALALTVLLTSTMAMAQLEVNKETKLYEMHNEELITVDRAGTGELINRFYHWGLEEFKDVKHNVERDDTTFRGVVFHVTIPLVDNHFGVKFTHTKRQLGFDVRFDAEKKDYSYWITNIGYKTVEVDRKDRTEDYDGKLEDFKGAAKRGLIEELDLVFNVMLDSFSMAGERDLTDAQMDEYDSWKDSRKDARDAAAKASQEAAKEAAAVAKNAAKEAAAAEKEEAKEVKAVAKEAAAAIKADEAEAAKKAREAGTEKE